MSVARVTDKFGCQEDALPATRRKGALCQATINCTKSALQRQPAQKETGLDTAERRPLHQLNWRGMLAPGTLVEFWLEGADLGYLEFPKPEKQMACRDGYLLSQKATFFCRPEAICKKQLNAYI